MVFDKKFSIIIKKRSRPAQQSVSPASREKRAPKPLRQRIFKWAVLFILFSSACALGALVGTLKAIRENLPSISKLEEYEPKIITYIFADDGSVVGEYAVEKRIEIPYQEIPDLLKTAILATEDPRFFKHSGVDLRGILRALREDLKIKLGGKPGKLHGGSTISQQLATELFLHRRQTIRRKLKEMLLSLQIEEKYTKEEIFTLYCNQFNLGHGAHGMEAAARLYFGKSVSELTLEETAMIVGILRGPSYYSPYRNREATLQRRNHVINRMYEEGYISRETAGEAKARPMNVLPLYRESTEFAAYFREEVRRYLAENYGETALYGEGLRVYTTLHPTYQKYAEEALLGWLRELDKRQGWRKDKRNLLEEGLESLDGLDSAALKDWPPFNWLKPSLEAGDIIEALVLEVTLEEATVRVKDYTGLLKNEGIDWTGTKSLKNILKQGDVIHVKVKKIDEESKILLVSLDQEPVLEGAFLAIEPRTGQVKAMVGGYSFRRSEWNNATQARRQAGSAIKPFLYTAALDSRMFTPATIIIDEPTDFYDKWSGEPYSPGNYDQKYKGAVTVRTGLEESRNIVTAKLLEFISPQKGVEYCRKFGLTTPMYPYLSLALGAPEVRLIEMVSAYSTFPNRGVRVKPYFIKRIEDKEGNILEEAVVESEEVISPQVAYMMTSLMQGVCERGTGWRARELGWPLAGKTGTTDAYTDAWFIGFSPSLCAGVWVGHKAKVPIGDRQSGAVAAQPPWMDFFRKVIRDMKKKMEPEMELARVSESEVEGENPAVSEQFEIPPNLSFVEIDYKTGLLATPHCLFTLKEVFLPGTEPDRFCSPEDHMMILDYYRQVR